MTNVDKMGHLTMICRHFNVFWWVYVHYHCSSYDSASTVCLKTWHLFENVFLNFSKTWKLEWHNNAFHCIYGILEQCQNYWWFLHVPCGRALTFILTARSADIRSHLGWLLPALPLCSSSLGGYQGLRSCSFHPDYTSTGHVNSRKVCCLQTAAQFQHRTADTRLNLASLRKWVLEKRVNETRCRVRAALVDTAPVGEEECQSSKYQAPSGTI